MAKHQQNFQYAGIDGSILVECNDKILLEVRKPLLTLASTGSGEKPEPYNTNA